MDADERRFLRWGKREEGEEVEGCWILDAGWEERDGRKNAQKAQIVSIWGIYPQIAPMSADFLD